MRNYILPHAINRHVYHIAALVFLSFFISLAAQAQEPKAKVETCSTDDRACVLRTLETVTKEIDNVAWRDQTYRELSKTKAFEGDFDGAIAMIDQISSPDTKAMTIRGIGMVAAENHFKSRYDEIFGKLRKKAEEIEHPPSYAIALTYIAMAQAFAKDNEGAWQTASDMENDALRHKAYGETAEIQAEHGDYDAAMKSIGFIDSEAFRNKAYSTTSYIFAFNGEFQKAYDAATKITNAYKKAASIQKLLDLQKPREQEKEGR